MSRKRQKAQHIKAGDILQVIKKRNRPATLKDIFKELRPNAKQKDHITSLLGSLVNQGKVISLNQGKAYGLPERMDLVHGTLELTASGAGFVLPEDQRRKDIFIAPSNLGDAWPGDRVVVALLPRRHGKNPEGRIVRILDRRMQEVPVILNKRMESNLFWAQSMERTLHVNFLADVSSLHAYVGVGDVVQLTAEERLDHDLWRGTATHYLGAETDTATQEKIVKLIHNIPTAFPEQVLKQADSLPPHPKSEDETERVDLTHLPFVTIDGAKAKDFDDAICVRSTSRGTNLLVAIADVSHYVPIGSALDQEAKDRANSYYFPQSVEPMFPPRLSTGLCSLNPRVRRLVMVVDMSFSSQAERVQAEFYPAVIQSQARLTYTQVQKGLLQGDPEVQSEIQAVMPMLAQAKELAEGLFATRQARGSLDFDLPEPELLFSLQGETVDIQPKTRHFGHQIIEEFMIAANEAVAEFLRDADMPAVYRVHPDPDPDKLKALFQLLHSTHLAHQLPTTYDVKSLQSLLHTAADSNLEFLVNRLLLRTMMQAAYNPDNQGHFGLASECYTHFTSPIRRYADLIVHRSLKAALATTPQKRHGRKGLRKLALHLNQRERTAMQAEREILKRLTICFLRDKIGQEFSGLINGVSDFGFWVELEDVMAEGLVRLSSLNDDYYLYIPEEHKLVGRHTGRTFVLGQSVTVKLVNVSILRLEIDFELIEPSEV